MLFTINHYIDYKLYTAMLVLVFPCEVSFVLS